MSSTWLYSIEPDLSGEENMLRDEQAAIACNHDRIPRLRMYSWRPYALSLGHNQGDEGIDRAAIAAMGFDVVRRPTGGRAVFHAEELTYAVAMPSNGDGIHATYARITEAIMRGLAALGARDLEFSRLQPDFREHYAHEESASCFSASALNELTWRGLKLLGSAQRRYGSVLLQHGSLLTGAAHLGIVDLLYPHRSPQQRDALRRRLAERTATLADVFGGHAPSFTELAEALRDGFASVYDVRMSQAVTAASFVDINTRSADVPLSTRT